MCVKERETFDFGKNNKLRCSDYPQQKTDINGPKVVDGFYLTQWMPCWCISNKTIFKSPLFRMAT